MRTQSGLKKYFLNTGYLIFEKIIRAFISFVVWAQVIRYLGPERFGIFSFVLSIVFLFGILSDLGLDAIVVREIIKHPENENQILGSTFTLKLVGSLLAIALAFSLGWVLVRDIDVVMLIFIISLQLIFKSFDTIDYYFQAHVQSKYSVYSKIISLSATTFFCFLFIYFRKSLIWFTAIVPVEIAVAGITLLCFYINISKDDTSWSVSFDIMKNLLKESWPLILSGVAISVYMRIDQIMIRQLIGDSQVGLYSAAVRVSEALYFIPIVIMSSVFPAIVSSKMQSEDLYYRRLQFVLGVLLWTAVIIAISISLFAKFILVGFLGGAYLPAAGVLTLHAWACIFVYLGVAGTRWLINENLQFFSMAYTALGAICNITLNFLLIPRYSIYGAALATVIAQCIAAVLANSLNKRTRKIFELQIKAFNITNIFKMRTRLI